MWSEGLERICLEYLKRYHKVGVPVQLGRLRGVAKRAAKKAEENYLKLEDPKTCSVDLYIARWVREVLHKGFVLKTLKKVDVKETGSDSFSKVVANYFSIFPYGYFNQIRKKIYDAKPEEWGTIWKALGLPIDEIEKRFIRMVIGRNKLVRRQGYSDLIDASIDRYKIPRSDYQRFIKNADKIIKHCNRQLPKINRLPDWFYSQFNQPCFVCILPSYPFKMTDEVVDYYTSKYEILNKFKDKVGIKYGSGAYTTYKKKTDSFLITLNKDENIRHKTLALVHELGHVIDMLNDFKKGLDFLEEGEYQTEKKAYKKELSLLKQISPDLYKAGFGDILSNFRDILFEVELYKSPQQKLSKLYANSFNRCFENAKQEKNPLFILDERIVMKPFSTLPHVVALSELILEEFHT